MITDKKTAQGFVVTVNDGDTVHQLQVDTPTNLLQMLLDSGFYLPSSCRNGVCGTCNVWLHMAGSSEKEVKACKFIADMPLTVTLPQLDSSAWPDEGLWVARVDSVSHLSADIVRLELALPPDSQFVASPGQFVALTLNNVTRYYSIFEHDKDSIKFIIKLLNQGEFSGLVKNLNGNELFRVSGPFGRLRVNMSEAGQNLYFICTGTGIVPVYNLLKNQTFVETRITIFWGNRCAEDFFMDLGMEFPSISVVEFCSGVGAATDSRFTSGRVSGRLENLIRINSERMTVCAIGNPQMVDDIRREAVEILGIQPNNFLSEKFVSHQE